MNTIKSKRWNGKIDTLSADYLNDVKTQMETYGDRVQFGLTRTGLRPYYQVINTADKKMIFDSNHHLHHPEADEFAGSSATGVFTLDQVNTAIAGGGVKSAVTKRGSRASSASRTAAPKAMDPVDTEKYAYFKNNRSTLPAGIGEYSEVIAELMRKGMSAEDAFGDIVKRHF